MNMRKNFIFLATAFFVISFFNTVQIKSHDQDLQDQQDSNEKQNYLLKQEQIKKLEKQIKLLTKKIDNLSLKIEEQEEVLNLHKNITNKEISIQEKQNFFSKFNWRKFFTIITSINAKKAALLIISLGIATGIINLEQVLYFAGKWVLKGVWLVFITITKSIGKVEAAIFTSIKDAIIYNRDGYIEYKEEHPGNACDGYNWRVNGCEHITDENGSEVIYPGLEAAVNWQYGV